MSRMVKVGVLAGAVTLGILGAGTAIAAPAPDTEGNGSAVVSEGFFKPGSDTLAVTNEGYTGPDVAALDPASAGSSTAPADGVAAGTTVPKVKNREYLGQLCGTTRIGQTSGSGKTTLVLTVSKSVSTSVTREGKIDLKYVSAGMGWDVTKSYTVSNQTRYEVPRGKFGTVEAYPLYDNYSGQAYNEYNRYTGMVFAMKPVGVCFNQWLK